MSKVKMAMPDNQAFKFHISTIEFRKLNEASVEPFKSKRLSIGYDLVVPMDTIVSGHSRKYVPLGFSIGLPRYVEEKIEPRSGFAGKGIEGLDYKWEWHWPLPHRVLRKDRFGCDVLVGKIDLGYKGEVQVIVKNYGRPFIIQIGTKIAQMTFYRVEDAIFLSTDTIHGFDRGGGMGSSGSKIKI